MRAASVKRHMKPYSIHKRRSTTIEHAFASAVSPSGPDDDESIRAAMELLGQNAERPLKCVFCLKSAETWDHLTPLVVKKMPSGYGHLLGNLVPACKRCNSSKGSKDWRHFLATAMKSYDDRAKQEAAIARYHESFAARAASSTATLQEHPLWAALQQKKEAILQLMIEADKDAMQIVEDLRRA